MKKRFLFYYFKGTNSYVPFDEQFEIDCLNNMETDEKEDVTFVVKEMTQEEFDSLPDAE